jgi:ERF superfamily
MSTEIQVAAPSPMQTNQLLISAIERGAGIDVIERLAKLQYDMQDREARIGFDEALNRCQSKMKRVAADMTNPQTHSKYASYAALDRAIRPEYTSEGFSISFGEDEGSTADYIVMLAYLSRGGHTRTYRKGMPIDTKGPKGNDVMTKTHAAGSGGSYAKRYLLKDIFNLAIGEDDDDGNLGVKNGVMDDLGVYLQKIQASSNLEELKKTYQEATAKAMNLNDQKAVLELMEMKDLRKGELA